MLADGFVRLTRLHGYARESVLRMTPRELIATLDVADRQYRHELRLDFLLSSTAARGTEDGWQKQLAALEEGLDAV